MTENPREILRDAVEVAKKTGLWERLTLKEKKEVVKYFTYLAGLKRMASANPTACGLASEFDNNYSLR